MSYDEAEAWDLVTLMSEAFQSYSAPRGRMTITADIKWNGYTNPKPHRTTTFFAAQQLDLRKIRAAVNEAMKARASAKVVFARPAPRSTGAQIRFLQRTRAGRAAWSAAGLGVTKGTLTRWLNGKQKPSAKNLAKIQAATREHHNARVNAAQERSESTSMEAVRELTEEIKQYGADTHFGNVTSLFFHP